MSASPAPRWMIQSLPGFIAFASLMAGSDLHAQQTSKNDAIVSSRESVAARADSLHTLALRLVEGNGASRHRAIAVLREEIPLRQLQSLPKEEGSAWNTLGHAFFHDEQFDSAAVAYRRAIAARTAAGDDEGVASSTNNVGNVFFARGQSDSAMFYYRRALVLDRTKAAITLGNMARVHEDALRMDSAMVYWREALRVVSRSNDHGQESSLHYSIGALHDRVDRLDSARANYVLAAAAAEQAGNIGQRSDAIYRIGNVHMQRGEPDSAAAYYRAGLALSRGSGVSARTADFLSAMGSYFRAAGQRDSAVTLLREALSVQRDLADTSGQVYALIAIARALNPNVPQEARLLADSARREYANAQALADSFGDASLRAAVHSSLAFYHVDRGQRASAVSSALQALELYRLSDNLAGQAGMLKMIGIAQSAPDSLALYLAQAIALAQRTAAQSLELEIHLAAGERYSDLTYGDSSRAHLAALGLTHLQQALRLARSTSSPVTEARVLQGIGHTHTGSRPARWVDAAAYFDSAWVVLEGVRQRTGDDATRISFAETHGNAARLLLWAWSERAKETGMQQDWRRALAAQERGRARALLDMMGDKANAALAGSLDTVAETLIRRVVRPGLAALTYVVGQETTISVLLPSGRIETFTNLISDDSLGRHVSDLRQSLGVELAAARAAPSKLEPLVDARSSRDLIGLQGPSAGTDALEPSLDRIADYALPRALRELLDRESITELVIVTDGAFALVPFAALPYDSARTPLGVRMSLRFAPSLALVANTDAKSEMKLPGASAMVVGNPSMPVVTGADGSPVRLNPLPGAEAEARTVAAALGASVLIGPQATEKAVREALATATVVHLATHGYAYASEHRVRDSFVALAPGNGEDGLLTVAEVADEVDVIRADLVVLSACQTALGTSTRSEGTVGLQRAFLGKGARSLLVSLWSVDDAVTETLMVRFYHHWLGGSSKGEALRRAQADIRRTHPNPRYWAAFQLVGAG